MKKLAILVITTLFALPLVEAQNQSPSENSPKAQRKDMGSAKAPIISTEKESINFESENNFNIDFPKASDVSWEKTGLFDQANFVSSDGQKMSAYYDTEGNLVGTTMIKSITDLPEKSRNILKDKYADYSVGQVIFFHDNDQNDNDNMILWATAFYSQDLYFAELDKGSNKIVVEITPAGDVSYFTEI